MYTTRADVPQLPDFISPAPEQVWSDYSQAVFGNLAASLGHGRKPGKQDPVASTSAPAMGPVLQSPSAQPVQLMVVDVFGGEEAATFADGVVGSHGGQCAYLADISSTATTTQVTALDIGDWQGKPGTWQHFLPQLQQIAASDNPPKVVNMSLGMSPADLFLIKKDFYDREFRGEHGAYWGADVQPLYEKGLQDLVKEANDAFQKDWGAIVPQLKETLTQLVDAGVTVTLSAGNAGEAKRIADQYGLTFPEGFSNGLFPADLPKGVILVGASQSNNANSQAAEFSSYQDGIDVAADGTELTVSKNGSLYNGTSFSTAQVAALAADLLAVDPSLTPAEIENILKASASAVPGQQAQVGAGVINRDKALEMAADPTLRIEYQEQAQSSVPAPEEVPAASENPSPSPAAPDVAAALKAAGMSDADVATFAPTVVGFEVDPANQRPGWPEGGPSFLEVLKDKLAEGVPAGDAILWARFSGLATNEELGDAQFLKDLGNAGPNGYGDTAWDSIKFARANQLTRQLSLSDNREPLALSLSQIGALLKIQLTVIQQLQQQGKSLAEIAQMPIDTPPTN